MQLSEQLPADVCARGFSRAFYLCGPKNPLAVAVSGGSDSMALLRLAQEFCLTQSGYRDRKLIAITVDHALRPESRSEAETVAGWCQALGIEHKTLVWDHGNAIVGNLPNAAREARYALMQAECNRLGVRVLLTGHTQDDQAETVLMRLARGSGVDGLSAIRPSVHRSDQTDRKNSIWLERPLLGLSRQQLRGHLRAIGQEWIDDPTNEDASFDRIKARQMFETLEPLGLTKERLATTARLMGMAREALETQAGNPNKVWDWSPLGFAHIDKLEFAGLPREIALRRLTGAMNTLTGATYRPRLRALERSLGQLYLGAQTLHGCILREGRGKMVVMREPNAVTEPSRPFAPVELWDHRFRIDVSGQPDDGLTIAMLGEAGVRKIPLKNKELSHSWCDAQYVARIATPALWRGDTLVSAPLAPWAADPDGPQLHVKALWSK